MLHAPHAGGFRLRVALPVGAAARDAGASTAEIAGAGALSDGMVRNSLSGAIQKVGARNSRDAARIAERQGWL